jgi:hypothetical protein
LSEGVAVRAVGVRARGVGRRDQRARRRGPRREGTQIGAAFERRRRRRRARAGGGAPLSPSPLLFCLTLRSAARASGAACAGCLPLQGAATREDDDDSIIVDGGPRKKRRVLKTQEVGGGFCAARARRSLWCEVGAVCEARAWLLTSFGTFAIADPRWLVCLASLGRSRRGGCPALTAQPTSLLPLSSFPSPRRRLLPSSPPLPSTGDTLTHNKLIASRTTDRPLTHPTRGSGAQQTRNSQPQPRTAPRGTIP